MIEKQKSFEVLLLCNVFLYELPWTGCSKSAGLKYFPITTGIISILMDNIHPLSPLLTINHPLFTVIQPNICK